MDHKLLNDSFLDPGAMQRAIPGGSGAYPGSILARLRAFAGQKFWPGNFLFTGPGRILSFFAARPKQLEPGMFMSGVRIGLLEDDKPQAELMMAWLEEAGYEPFHCETGHGFLQAVRKDPPDVLILDWQLPDCEGIDVLSRLRNSMAFDGPVLFATAKDNEEDVVRGLNAGADDYLTKPLRQAELMARLAAVRRRSGQEPAARLSLGPIELDEENRLACIDGEPVSLTHTEFQLARCLFSNVGKLLSREFLLRDVWGTAADLDTRTVDVHMSRVRRLLRIGPDMGYCIKTIYRHGYRLEAL